MWPDAGKKGMAYTSETPSSDEVAVAVMLRLFLEDIAKDDDRPGRTVLVIDGIDQLQGGPSALNLSWLPQASKKLRVIVSGLPSAALSAALEKANIKVQVQMLEMPKGQPSQTELILDGIIKQQLEKPDLPSDLRKKIAAAPACKNPAVEELWDLGSQEKPTPKRKAMHELLGDFFKSKRTECSPERRAEEATWAYARAGAGLDKPKLEKLREQMELATEDAEAAWGVAESLHELESTLEKRAADKLVELLLDPTVFSVLDEYEVIALWTCTGRMSPEMAKQYKLALVGPAAGPDVTADHMASAYNILIHMNYPNSSRRIAVVRVPR
eukprot:tig00020510_g9887.t1